MPKRTAIIDIGSNSARMAIFEKTSHHAFHLIHEVKGRVRIGEGAYNFGGVLQKPAMKRAFTTLEEFSSIIKSYRCSKVLCLATSALRDAPNAKEFLQEVHQKLHLSIQIIDGKKEAYYGAIGALNYLKKFDSAVTIDIGGGSTELAKIENGKIIDTISLNVGTVRLKELFFDKKAPLTQIQAYLNNEVNKVPESFKCANAIAIGGTLRSLAKIIMERTQYPLKTVHAFEYEIKDESALVDAIVKADVLELKNFGVRKDRFDTMREGCIIFQSLYEKLSTKRIITSGAGIREGAYLHNLLRKQHSIFHPEFKLSLRSFKDRFGFTEKDSLYMKKLTETLFDALAQIHQLNTTYKYELGIAAELHTIGTKLGFYQNHLHSFYFIINNLNYGFSHQEKVLIATLIKHHTNKLPAEQDMLLYQSLLPNLQTVQWLSFLLNLVKVLNSDMSNTQMSFSYQNHTLTIDTSKTLFLAREQIKQLVKPASFAIIIK